jgi:hypothetical protein
MIPLTLDYLQAALAQYTCPLVVFSKDGLAAALPDLFNQQDLATLARGVIMAASPEAAPATLPAPDGDRAFARYAAYLRTTAAVKALLGSAPYVRDPFVRPVSVAVEPPTAARFDQIEDWLQRVGPLRDCDRADIAYLLVKHGRVYQAADLFVRLTTGKPLASDLVDCRDAFEIGRHLYLLGRHEAAAGFLALAFARHPFNSEYEMWHHIVRAKLDQPPMQFYSPPTHQPDLQRYYLTVADVRKGNKARAQKRLEKMLARDSLDSLANHLLNKYFSRPLDERYFFPAPEGL